MRFSAMAMNSKGGIKPCFALTSQRKASNHIFRRQIDNRLVLQIGRSVLIPAAISWILLTDSFCGDSLITPD